MVTTRDDALAERIRRAAPARHDPRRLEALHRRTASWRYDVVVPRLQVQHDRHERRDRAGAAASACRDMQAERRRARRALPRRARRRRRASSCRPARPDVEHAWHLFVVRVRPSALRIGRDEVIRELNAAGIGTSVHFIPLHEHSYYRDVLGVPRRGRSRAPAREWQRIISLPLFPGMTDDDVDRVADTLREHRPPASSLRRPC